jgi:hypothetical protein
MPRQANAIDFWRGFALVSIFINHVPGIYYSKFTHANISISDSADLFVFLAGWSLRYVVGSERRKVSTYHLVLRLGARAFTIYAAQILITMLAVAMLAAAAIILNNPLILEWHNAAAVFHDPVTTHIGLALITHQLGYFDILPLYVALMLMAPAFAVIDRYAPNWLLPLSVALYCAVLTFRLNPPSWPVAGGWFFNPLAWQLLFVLGFVLARDAGVGAFVRRNIVWFRLAAIPILLGGLLITYGYWWPDPTTLPQPRLFFLVSKTYISPIRLLQFLALVAVFSMLYPYIRMLWAGLTDFLSLLGRNSLQVFCVSSLLSLAGQITRFVYRGYISVDTVVVIVGILIMALTAWLTEWRDRVREKASSPVPASS